MSLPESDNTSTSNAPETKTFNIFYSDWTSTSVPTELSDMVIMNDVLHVDVLNAGPMVGTNLDKQRAEDKGLVKNHWVWRALIANPEDTVAQIVFGFNSAADSVGSNEARYAASSRLGISSSNFGSNIGSDVHSKDGSENARFSSVEDFTKPPAVDTSSIAGGVAGASDAGKSDVSQVGDAIATSIVSSTDRRLYKPIEGPPASGSLVIKVRPRAEPSWKTYLTRSFRLKHNTTFGDLMGVIKERHMEGFKFRKLGMAYMGCRDGISQAAAWWKAAGLLLEYECVEQPRQHIFDMLGWRYTQPAVPAGLSDLEGLVEPVPFVKGWGRSVSWIDRAVWPTEYVHAEHEKLVYNQRADLPTVQAPDA